MERAEDTIYKTLRQLRCFRRMDERDLRILLRYGRHVSYRKQQALCYQSEPAREVFLILSGRVKRVKYRADESCVVLGQLDEGDWVGLTEVLLGSPCLTDAIVEEKTEALVFSSKALGEVMKIPLMKDSFLEYLARSLFLLHSQIELNVPLPRIVRFVLARARRRSNGSACLITTQDEIAQAVGVTRETVNKYLQSLQDDGLIQVGRGRIDIPDCEALDERSVI